MKKITLNAPAILAFALICVLAHGAVEFFGSWMNEQFFSVYRSSLTDPATYFRGLFHVIGYDTWSELVEDMMMILMIGPLVEEKHTTGKIVKSFVLVAILTAVVHCAFFPGSALLGAKGIIYALIIMASFTGNKGDGIPLTLLLVAVLYLGKQVRIGYFSEYDLYTLAYVVESVIGGVVGLVMVLKK